MRTLCIDFDGVIHSFVTGWRQVDDVPDPPVPGSMEFLALAVKHFKVSIYSARSPKGGLAAMQQYVFEHLHNTLDDAETAQNTYDALLWPEEKPSAFLTIDDRVHLFDGTWPTIESLHAFKPWNHNQKRKTRGPPWNSTSPT